MSLKRLTSTALAAGCLLATTAIASVGNTLSAPSVSAPRAGVATVDITGDLVNVYGVNMAILIDPTIVDGYSISSTAFEDSTINMVDDTLFVGLASGAPVNLVGGAIATLEIDIPAGATLGNYSLTWVAYPETHANEAAVGLVDGQISVVNILPVWDAQADTSTDEDQTLSFTVNATDGDGDGLTYSATTLPTGATFTPGTQVFDWLPGYFDAGPHSATFRVDDGFDTVDMTVAITVNNVNRLPTWTQTPAQTVNETELVEFVVEASDLDLEELTYSMPGELPTGWAFDAGTRTFSWTTTYEDSGSYVATFNVTDGTTPQAMDVDIRVDNVNRLPIFDAVSAQVVDEAQTVAFTVSATDPDGQTMTLAMTDGPAAASFDAGTGDFTWVTDHFDSGVYAAEFSVFDTEDYLLLSVDITVNNVNRAPVWDARPDTTAEPTVELSFSVGATDLDLEDLTYSMTTGPVGAAFDPGTQVFTWTADYLQAGDTVAVFSVTDGIDAVTDEVAINVPDRFGDVTESGDVTALDASWILQFSTRIRASINEILADVTASEAVTAYDAALVLYQVVNPGYVFPVLGGSVPATPRLARVDPRVVSVSSDDGAWIVSIDDVDGVLGCDFTFDLGEGAPEVTVAGTHVAYRQEGSILDVGLALPDQESGVLLRIEGVDLTSMPTIESVSLNEGGIPAIAAIPVEFALAQNAPNPFNPTTSIRFGIAEAGPVQLSIYNANGQVVRVLVDGAMETGMHEVTWDGLDAAGRNVASGIYVYRLTSGTSVSVRRMSLVR